MVQRTLAAALAAGLLLVAAAGSASANPMRNFTVTDNGGGLSGFGSIEFAPGFVGPALTDPRNELASFDATLTVFNNTQSWNKFDILLPGLDVMLDPNTWVLWINHMQLASKNGFSDVLLVQGNELTMVRCRDFSGDPNDLCGAQDIIATGTLEIEPPHSTDVPEPATALLFGVGLIGLGLARRRKAG